MAVPSAPLVNSLLGLMRSHPDRPAFLLADNGTVSFRQFGSMVSAIAARLRQEGLTKGDRVLLCAPNGVPFAAAYFGVHAAGCVAVPIDFDASPETAQALVAECEPRLALTAKDIAIPVASVSLVSVCADHRGEPELVVDCSMDDVADILYTTGTTGTHKGVVLTHGNISHAATNINAFVGGQLGDVEVVPIPLSHSFGLGRLRCMAQSGVTLAMEVGMRNAAKVLQHILQARATGLALVPAGFELLLRMTKDRLADARHHLRYIEIGSSTMSLETKQKLMALLPDTRICHHYGLTEASRSAFIEYHADREKLGSIGHAAPNVQIAILSDEGRELGPGEYGEVVVRGGMVMKEYWRRPELTQTALRDGWLHTGDWGCKDSDGYFHLIGRRADLINVAGLKVSPVEVERLLNAHPAITESACVGAPDPQGLTGQCVKAYLVAQTPVTDVELIEWLRPHIEEYKIPRLWEHVECIPKTASGKIQRQLLL